MTSELQGPAQPKFAYGEVQVAPLRPSAGKSSGELPPSPHDNTHTTHRDSRTSRRHITDFHNLAHTLSRTYCRLFTDHCPRGYRPRATTALRRKVRAQEAATTVQSAVARHIAPSTFDGRQEASLRWVIERELDPQAVRLSAQHR
jgi:hypothetical protein